jgi:thiamine-phosphate pyrophosphorylase
MSGEQPSLPKLWLLSDERNDAKLEWAIATLPERSAFVFRHYFMKPKYRRQRFDALAPIARAGGHLLILSDEIDVAADWGADGIYHHPTKMGRRDDLLRIATAHNAREIFQANRNGADALFLSPVYPTRSHPGGACLGTMNFHDLAARSQIPVIALGGMDAEKAEELGCERWGAIDGLS